MKKRIPYSYVIFYLERKYYHLIEKELKEKGYENIKVIIPTLDILKRTVRVRWYLNLFLYFSIMVL